MVKKISRIKMIYILFSVLVMFCAVCPHFTIYAADNNDDEISKYMHGSDYVTKNGYYYEQENFTTALQASSITYNTNPYECENTCFKDDGTPYIPSNNSNALSTWNSFVSGFGSHSKISDVFDLYFVLYEAPNGGASNVWIRQTFFWVPKGTSICMGYSAYTGNSKQFYYNEAQYARVYVNSDKGIMSTLSTDLKGRDYFTNFITGNTYGSSSFSDDSVLGAKFFQFESNPGGLHGYRLISTNIPLVKCAENLSGSITDYSNCKKFLDGDTSLADNSDPNYVDKPTYPAESFYWDDMTCKVSSLGIVNNKQRYAFAFKYNYSCPLMNDPSELFSVKVIYNVDIRYQDGKGRTYGYSDSVVDNYSLNKHKNSYMNNNIYLNGDVGDNSQWVNVAAAFDFLTCLISNGSNLEKYSDCVVKSAKLYVTVFLYHVPDPDRFFSDGNLGLPSVDGGDVPSDSKVITSTDVRYFPFDLYTLKPDEEISSQKPTVVTDDVTDDDGNVVDKKVTDVVANDNSGKTVINITIDNSNKVIDGNANINTGGGSGYDDDDDKNSKSFWKYVTGIVAFFTALLNSDSGLFAVIASYFKFIPGDFWTVTIGAIVVIAVLSIYRLAKKGG